MARDTSVKAPAARRKTPAKPAGRPSAATASATPAVAAVPERTAPAGPPFWSAAFWTEVRTETRKISWPSWKETWITSVMVAIMVTFTAVFFLLVDGSLSFLLQQVLKLAG